MTGKQPRLAHKNRRFDKLRRFLWGKPWNERNASEKVKAIIVDVVLLLAFGVPILLAVFGTTWDAVKDTAFGSVVLVVAVVALFGGALLSFVLWVIGKFK